MIKENLLSILNCINANNLTLKKNKLYKEKQLNQQKSVHKYKGFSISLISKKCLLLLYEA